MNCEELVKYLNNLNKMKSKYPDVYALFKVSVPVNSLKQFTDPEIWLEYVGVDAVQQFVKELKFFSLVAQLVRAVYIEHIQVSLNPPVEKK